MDEHPEKCRKCGQALAYSGPHDAVACLKCDVWIELTCDDPTCWACSDRPLTPSAAVGSAPRRGASDRHFLHRIIRLIPAEERPPHTRQIYAALVAQFTERPAPAPQPATKQKTWTAVSRHAGRPANRRRSR